MLRRDILEDKFVKGIDIIQFIQACKSITRDDEGRMSLTMNFDTHMGFMADYHFSQLDGQTAEAFLISMYKKFVDNLVDNEINKSANFYARHKNMNETDAHIAACFDFYFSRYISPFISIGIKEEEDGRTTIIINSPIINGVKQNSEYRAEFTFRKWEEPDMRETAKRCVHTIRNASLRVMKHNGVALIDYGVIK